jgi:hypothetical protein
MVVYGADHEEKTKTEPSIYDLVTTSATAIKVVSLSMEKDLMITKKLERIDALINKEVPVFIDKSDTSKYENIFNEANLEFKKQFSEFVIENILKQKNDLIEYRIKEYLPDFNFNDELKRKVPRLYSNTIKDETNIFLIHKKSHIRLITFVKKEKPMEINASNYSISFEEHYY